MARTDPGQFNVRSARARAHDLAKRTGITVTQVVEEALRGHVPPGTTVDVDRLARRGPILVLPSGGATISLSEADAALDEVRERDLAD
jgi:hypothetical protein